MAIRQYKPVTPGRRQGSVSDFAEITDRKRKPEKKSTCSKKEDRWKKQSRGYLHEVSWGWS